MTKGYQADKRAIDAAYLEDSRYGQAKKTPQLSLRESRAAWLQGEARRATLDGDNDLYAAIKAEVSREHSGSLLEIWIHFYDLEPEAGSDEAFAFLIKNAEHHADYDSPWGWFWKAEYYIEMRRYHEKRAEPELAIEAAEAAFALAKKNDFPTKMFRSAEPLPWLYLRIDNYKRSREWLEEIYAIAKEMNSPRYLAYCHAKLSYQHVLYAEYGKALRCIRLAQKLVANSPHSHMADYFHYQELEILALTGDFSRFRKLHEKMRQSVIQAKRGPYDFTSQHIAIELLELMVATYDATGAEACIRQFRLLGHECCEFRVRIQLLRLEIQAGEDKRVFFKESDRAKADGANFSTFYRLRARLYLLELRFRQGKWQGEEKRELEDLGQRIGLSPFPLLRYLWKKFELERALASGAYDAAEELRRQLLDDANRLGLRAEAACLEILAQELGKKLGLKPAKKSKVAALRTEFGEALFENYLGSWPYKLLREQSSILLLRWQPSGDSFWINEYVRVKIPAHAPLGKLAGVFAKAGRQIVSYESLARKIWDESYDPVYHDHKIQVLVSDFREALEKQGIAPAFLENCYGKGYRITSGGERKKPSKVAPNRRREEILAFADSHPCVDAAALAKKFGYNVRQAQRDLQALVADGLLESRGAKKNRHYVKTKKAA